MSVTRHATSLDHTAAAKVLHSLASGSAIGDEDDLPAQFAAYASAPNAIGLELQLAVLDLWREAGENVGAWKVGSTARGKPNADVRPFGYILHSRIVGSDATVDAASIPGCAIEPEVAVTFGQRLFGDVSPAQAREAVSSVSPAFEICSFRLPTSAPQAIRVADTMSNWGLLIGPEHSPEIDLATVYVELWRDSERLGNSGTGLDILASAYESLANAARLLGERGMAFEPGQHAILGSMLPAAPTVGANQFTADFGDLGSIVLHTTPASRT
jgi:2-keto-4-pentenoate hydratase